GVSTNSPALSPTSSANQGRYLSPRKVVPEIEKRPDRPAPPLADPYARSGDQGPALGTRTWHITWLHAVQRRIAAATSSGLSSSPRWPGPEIIVISLFPGMEAAKGAA